MSWQLGFDDHHKRDIGYGVPAICDHPDCNEEIHRGLAYVCCNEQPHGGEDGCGLYFCSKHSNVIGKCERCESDKEHFKPKEDTQEWVLHKLNHKSWREWRKENPDFVDKYGKELGL